MFSIAWGGKPGHLLDLNIRQQQWPPNLLSKWFKGHGNVLRGEFELISPAWCLRQSQKALRGPGSMISTGYNQRKCVDLLWGLESYTWLEWKHCFCTPSPVSQYLAATKHHHMPGWRGVKSLQRWHKCLSQDSRSMTRQSVCKQSKHKK